MAIKLTAMQHWGTIATMMIIFSCLVVQNEAQVQQRDCTNALQPCLNYLNGNSRPPDSCCQPLEYVIKSLPECLCSFMTVRGSNQAEKAGINVTEAQTLPGRCGQRINPLGCITGTPDTRSSTRNSVPRSSGGSTIFGFSSLVNIGAAASTVMLVIFQAL